MKVDPIKVLPLEQLQLNEGQLPWLRKNPRSWTQTDIDRTKRSLDEDAELMQARPLLAVPGTDKDTFVVFGGNLRLTAARALGWPGAPVVVFHPDNEKHPSEIDKQTIHRIAIKDNGSFGSWDTDELANWDFDPIELEDFGLPDFVTGGAGSGSVEAGAAGPSGSAKEDGFDPDDKEGILVRCNPGDIWELGEHRLMCGDSTDLETVKSLMGGGLADMSFTSPPYNAGDSEKLSGNTHFDESKYKHYADNADKTEYLDLLMKTTSAEMEVSKYAFVNLQPLAGNKVSIVDFLSGFKNNLCDILIWRKTNAAPAMAQRVCNSQFEFVFVFSKKNASRAIGTRVFRGTESNVFDCSPQRNNEYAAEHAATFSVGFVGHYIETFTNKGESVLDLFGGTGTTMIAAEQLGRKCYMMELDPHYCDVIIARWEKLTGQKARRIAPDAN